VALLRGVVATTSAQALIAANGENLNGVSHNGFVAPTQVALGAKVLKVMLPPSKAR
jgi:hypothetical protein